MAIIGGLLFVLLFMSVVINLIPIVFKALKFLVKAFGYVFKKIFLSRRFLESLLWIMAAFVALLFTFRALGRQFLTGEDAKALIAENLPPRRNLHERTISLLTIELILELRKSYDEKND